ncbi:MAG: hypothetical protein Q8N31_13835 [Reyranella sp.]|nr:hypothetical protein [Reyranella sp.]MDP3161096.1 hypothetical protein [Reyranella sp.]
MIGLDFDNTLVDYAEAFRAEAARLDLGRVSTKTEIRDCLRLRAGGEIVWQKLQARVYGPGIAQAQMMQGARAFIDECIRRKIPLAIISHKTRYAAQDPGGVDLRQAAREWLGRQNIGIAHENVFFEETREAKLNRIGRLDCRYFVDDLSEVLLDQQFPPTTQRLWLTAAMETPQPPIDAAGDWFQIARYIFVS